MVATEKYTGAIRVTHDVLVVINNLVLDIEKDSYLHSRSSPLGIGVFDLDFLKCGDARFDIIVYL